MKLKKIFLSLVLVFGIGIFANNISANASSWHKGTPKALRGIYAHKMPKGQFHPYSIYIISPNKVESSSSGMTMSGIHHLYYRSLGHKKYVLKFDVEQAGNYLAQKGHKDYVTKHGNKIKLVSEKGMKPWIYYKTHNANLYNPK